MRVLRMTQAGKRLCVALLLAACSGKTTKQGDAHIEAGDALQGSKQPQHAIAEYELALKTPLRDAAVLRLASAYEASGELAKAETFLREASQKQPTDPSLRLALARVLAASGRARQAFEEARQLAKTTPSNPQALTLMAASASTQAEARLAADKLAGFYELEAHRNTGHAGAELLVPLAALQQQLGQSEAAKSSRDAAARIGIQDLGLALSLADIYFRIARLLPAEELLELATKAKRASEHPEMWRRLAAVHAGLRDYEAARAALDQLPKPLRAEPESLVIDAEIKLGLGQPSEAASLLTAFLARPADIETRRERSRAQFWLGNTLLARHDTKAAERAWTEALNVDPTFEIAELALCEQYLDDGEAARALLRLTPLVARQPQSSEAYRLLGRALLDTHDAAGAEAAFQRYAELRPDDPNGQYLVATALIARGQRDAARTHLETALALNPAAIEPLRALVKLMAAQGHADEAENRLQIELARRGRGAKLLALLGDILGARPAKAAQAEQAYLEALASDLTYEPARLALGQLYVDTQRDGAALLLYQAGLDRSSAPAALWLQIAQLHAAGHAGAEARYAYERVLALEPDSVPALIGLAQVQVDLLRQPTAAVEPAARARTLAPTSTQASAIYGWALLQAGNADEALPLLEDAARKLPKSPEAQYHLGVALLKLGQTDNGRAAISRALELSPTFNGAEQAKLALNTK